ncbi:MAG: ABC transporter ATP-binding protein [Cytophagaceae bacterium]|nr:ABC transporter ATP-binding protein [Cytophagaceae bacterium]MBK9508502.1 ABC transporter ATP-binding protein [Cytophagaceae bacterium]MBK9935480.1 ABC transporter ATP-binding protein [Cytophagaceae bacterium]MBL0301920.1 ABC transporter ATP-binding protein [Cytophagaceae bacterium]MBL0324747.1 ABC transporter ATP-binding protein [Cytophagaceae bacterium]
MAQEKSITVAISRLLDLVKKDKRDVYSIYLLSILAGIVSLSLPLGIQTIIGFVMAGSLSTSIVILIVLVLIGTFLSGFLQIKQLEFIEKIEQKIFVRYALEFGSKLPHLNIEKLDSHYLPELVNRFFDVPTLQKSLHKLLVDIPAALFQILLGTLLLSFYHPLFIAFGIVLLLIVIVVLKTTSAKGFETSIYTSDYKYNVVSWLEDIARSIKTFKFGRESMININRTDSISAKYIDARTKHFKILKIQFWSLVAFKLLITAAMLILGVVLLINQQINIGQFIAADIVIIAIMASIEKLIGNMDQVYEALTAVEKLNKVIGSELEKGGSLKLSSANQGLSVVFDAVSFSYPDTGLVFEQLNFGLNSGEWMLITGKSGSGKSTILRLLSGTFTDFKGKIFVDGLPIKNYDLHNLRSNMGMLFGQLDLFSGTLLQNITLDNPNIDLEKVKDMTCMVGLDEYVKDQEYGFDAMIDPMGKRLPAIVKNQILLCRALIMPSKLYILEDPFGCLKDKNTVAVIDYLKNTGATVIVTGNHQSGDFDKVLEL